MQSPRRIRIQSGLKLINEVDMVIWFEDKLEMARGRSIPESASYRIGSLRTGL